MKKKVDTFINILCKELETELTQYISLVLGMVVGYMWIQSQFIIIAG